MPRRGIDAAAVIAAAAELADAEGLPAVTVARVAATLGIRAPSLYNHVPGRDGLVRGIALLGLGELAARLRSAAVGRSGEDALLSAARAYRRYAVEHPGRYESVQRAPAAEDEELAAAGRAVVGVLMEVLRAWDLGDADAIHAVRALRSALHGFVDLERVGGFGLPLPLDESYDRLVRSLAAGLRSGARRGAGRPA